MYKYTWPERKKDTEKNYIVAEPDINKIGIPCQTYSVAFNR